MDGSTNNNTEKVENLSSLRNFMEKGLEDGKTNKILAEHFEDLLHHNGFAPFSDTKNTSKFKPKFEEDGYLCSALSSKLYNIYSETNHSKVLWGLRRKCRKYAGDEKYVAGEYFDFKSCIVSLI